MDYEGLHADVNKILNKHFTTGRGGNSIQYVVIHYNDGDLTTEGCYSVWQTREASAHYQVESSGRIGQLVWDKDTAWHASNFKANQKSIGIEHANQGSSMTNACIENGAHLCAAICKYYKLGRPTWLKNVFPHCYFASTDCPGPLRDGTGYHDRYMKRAQAWYDAMSTDSKPSDDSSSSDSKSSSNLGDTRYTGPLMVTEWQSQLGTDTDSKISNQSTYIRSKVLVNVESKCFDGNKTGKDGSSLVKALQHFLNDEMGAGLDVDGLFGHDTTKWLQKWLNSELGLNLDVDGYYGSATSSAVGNALEKGLFK